MCDINISVSFENVSTRQVNTDLLEKIAILICAEEAPEVHFEIGVLICTEIQMRKHNRIYRGVDATTDILSFVTAQMPLMADGREWIFRMCDLIIDINQIAKQKGSKSLNDELVEVYIHGLLHLCEYDHIRENDKTIMKDKELYYQKKLRGENRSG
ncbi:MAG: rRNA maturation RNase YbeY [Candidatus Cloacimonadaceae bacterium]|nr:rRNA maturation RNase YbeY [Candidatus Cloacimonadaceae bacterium]